ncbi:MAG: hypothetical protein V3573_04545 [Desulfovibrionaceae bacterium]
MLSPRTMFRALLLAFLTLALALPALAGGKLPDLTGTWQGKVEIHRADKGFQTNSNHLQFVIKEQQGHVFHGVKTWTDVAGGKYSEPFSGIISVDGEDIYVVEHSDGHMTGEVESKDRIYLYYLEGGESPKAIFYELDRVK